MIARRPVIALTVLLAGVVPARAQQAGQPSLADVARQAEAARDRGAVKKARKAYTNKDLGATPAVATSEPSTGFVSKTTGQEVSAEELVKRGEQQVAEQQPPQGPPEATWRQRAKYIRDQVDTTKTRLNKYLHLPENPDPAQQRKVQNAIVAMRTSLTELENRWSALEKSASENKADPSWIAPPPDFSQVQ